MKVIIPLAGKGTRLRPHTHTKAKPLFHIAGNTVLGHILDDIKDNKDIEKIIFITGHLGYQIEEYVKKNYNFETAFIEQTDLNGQAPAIKLAKPFIKDEDDVLIWFVDTISDADISSLKNMKEDGAIFVKKVEDPRRFGQHKVNENGIIIDNKEKADPPISNLVNIGIYYTKSGKELFDAIDELIEKNIKTKGEYFLLDALQIMMDKGLKFTAPEVKVWEDCGKPDAVLKTNRYFLDNGKTNECSNKNCHVIPPVHIEEGVVIEDSIVGPYVSVAKGSKISSSIIRDSIVGKDSAVISSNLVGSIIGDNALVKGTSKRLNVGDDSEIKY